MRLRFLCFTQAARFGKNISGASSQENRGVEHDRLHPKSPLRRRNDSMHFRRLFMVAGCACFAFLTACSNESGRLLVAPVRPPTKLVPMSQPVNAFAAGAELAKLRNRALVFAVAAGIHTKEQPSVPTEPSSVVSPPTLQTTVPAATSSIDWDCIAEAETGSDFGMHGSSYSSAYGVMNQAVRENSSPEVAARILAGVASKEEQLAMAQSIAAKFGIDAWAASTVAKCT